MTSLSEQLSAVRKSQWEAQLDVFRALGDRALKNTEQLIALNLKTSRATAEQVAGTFRQLLDARDPSDLAAVTASAQGQWQHLLAYGSELLSIATGTRVATWSTLPLPAPGANVPASVSQAVEQAAIATAGATTINSEIAAAAADTGQAMAEAALDVSQQAIAKASAQASKAAPTEVENEKAGAAPSETPQGDEGGATLEVTFSTTEDGADEATPAARAGDVPPARAKPIARALNKVAPRPAAAEHPIASTVPLETNGRIDVPPVTPTDLLPPLHATAAEAKPSRASRKK